MKVLKRGNIPGTEIYKGTCSNCNSEMEALKKELTIRGVMARPGESGSIATEECPVCKEAGIVYTVYFKPTGTYWEA